MPEPDVLSKLLVRSQPAVRVVADAAALDAAAWPADCSVLRIAPDDALVMVRADTGSAAGAATSDMIEVAAAVTDVDPFAIVELESGFVGTWIDTGALRFWVERHADWHLPHGDGLSQGMVAALPVKILVEAGQALVLVPASFASELAERFQVGP